MTVWLLILVVVVAATLGDAVLARGMKKMGDLDVLRRERGIFAVAGRVMSSPAFMIGIAAHAVAYFSLLAAFSHADLSLVGPATASLTFVATVFAGKFYLGEQVDARRWVAAILVCAGVFLLTR